MFDWSVAMQVRVPRQSLEALLELDECVGCERTESESYRLGESAVAVNRPECLDASGTLDASGRDASNDSESTEFGE